MKLNLRYSTYLSTILLVGIYGGVSKVSVAQAQIQAQDESIDTVRDVVVVYDERAPVAADLPLSISSLGQETLTEIAAVHPAESLNSVVGVNIHRGSGQEHLTAIRSPVLTGGAGAGSFLYLEDGVPLRAAGFANVNGLFEGLTETAQSLEVVKGPGPVLYGSNAVHGLINIVSPSVEGPNRYQILGSDDGLAAARVSAALGPVRVTASVTHDNGFRADSGYDQQKLGLRYEGQWGAWEATGQVSIQNLSQETAGFVQGDDAFEDEELASGNAFPEAFRDSSTYRAHLKLERDFGEGTLSVTPYARDVDLRFLRHFVPGQALEENSHRSVGVLTSYYGDDFNVGLDAEYTEGELFEFQDNPTVFSFTQGLHFDYEVESIVIAGFAEKDFQLTERLSFNIGARGEYTRYDYDNRADSGISGRFIRLDDRRDDYFTLTPKASLTFAASEAVNLYARAARSSRAPQTSDLYSLQQNQVPGEAEVETLDSLELGFKGRWGDLVLDLAGFVQKKDNFFFRNANGFNVSNGQTNHTGIEASFYVPLNDYIAVRGSGTLAKHSYDFTEIVGSAANDITDGDRVDTAPDTLGHVTAIFTPIDRVTVELEWRHVGSYFTDPGNTNEYDGHDLFVARGDVALTDKLNVFGRVDNLFNIDYADRADFAFGNERFFPGRPRTVFFGLKGEF
ncbi:MAG: TonB-dependent receptor [Maricaulaceae bacterium]